jgi:4-amino-4-deoxy-L-arabinose transferase-like glycosyltransferase
VSDAFLKPDDREASGRLLFALALLAGALLRLVLLGSPDLFGPDEGAWALAARNAAEGGFGQLLAPGRTPLGEPAGTPFFFPAVLSVMVRIFGAEEWAIRLPSVGAGLIGAFVLERVVRRGYGQPAGHLAGAFAALFPPLVSASRAATAETAFVALGLGGVIFGLRALEEDVPSEAILAGTFFGLAFLTRGHAVLVFLGPLLLSLLARPALWRLGKTRLSAALLLGTGAAVSAGYLGLVRLARPAALGTVFAGLVATRPAWPYGSTDPSAFDASLKAIVGTLFLFLPLAGLGVAFLLRPRTETEFASGATSGERRLSHEVLWGAAGVEMLVLVAVAGVFRLSSIPVLTALSAFCGFGATALLRSSDEPALRRRDVAFALVSGLLVLGAAGVLVSLPDDPLFGGRQAPLSTGAALGSIAAVAALAALLSSGRLRAGGRPAVVFLSALLVASGVESAAFIRRELLSHRTYARETAQQLAPLLLPRLPADLAFRASDPDPIAFHLFRTGRSWTDVPTAAAFEAEVRRGTTSGWSFRRPAPGTPPSASSAAVPPEEVRAFLAAHAVDVTGDVAARAGRDPGALIYAAPASGFPPP